MAEHKQQFNVYLSPDLVRRVKHAAVDCDQSLSAFVAAALEAHLAGHTAAPLTSGEGERLVKPVPIVYVTDMDRSLSWYRTVLPHAEVISSSPMWSELAVGGAALALHRAESVTAGTQVGLAFEASGPLEDLVAGLADGGIAPARHISDEAFGRSLVVRDPDGLMIQVNEHDPEFYPGQ